MGLPETLAVLMVVAVCGLLFFGYPVALTLGGVSLAFALLGHLTGLMNFTFLGALPQRIFGVMINPVLLAIPLFIFMGVMLERSRIAEELLETMGRLFGTLRGGLGISVAIVGTLLAAAKGVVGATTVTMGLIVLPTMLRYGYDKRLAAGTVAATATLAQIFPPATVLVLLGDQLSTAYQAAQLAQGNFAPSSVTVSDLFAGALVPAFALVALYILYLIFMAVVFPKTSPAIPPTRCAEGLRAAGRLIAVLVAPLLLILAVLGSILGGIATPTEAASVGAVGAILLAASQRHARRGAAAGRATHHPSHLHDLRDPDRRHHVQPGVSRSRWRRHGSSCAQRPAGGGGGAILVVMLAIFLLGFVMDAFEIIFVVVPIVAVPLLQLHHVDPVWLGIMIAMNLQTSYMHPPLGPTLFFLRGVAPPEITTRHIYVGIIPFVLIQLFALVMLWFVPGLATALPHALYGGR